jgi:bacteriocin-like protein
MLQKSKITRTRIADLPELTESEMQNVSGGLVSDMRIVSGGLRASVTCFSRVAVKSSFSATKTEYVTNGDWDTD